jgi:hypothetical protein
MYLAVELGQPNVDRMLRGITARQFFEWEVYFAMDPFGQARDDIHRAMALQMLHNVNTKKEHQKPVNDFLLRFGLEERPPRKQTWQEQLAVARQFVEMYNASL